ncbi:26418_t:CDS:2, partial [Dentiscutata erythropus]
MVFEKHIEGTPPSYIQGLCSIPTQVPKLIAELIIKCWNSHPTERPASEEIYDTICMWNNDILNDKQTKFVEQMTKADESLEKVLASNLSHPKVYSEEIYTSRRFDFLSQSITDNKL